MTLWKDKKKDKAEEALESLFKLSPDIICICTPEGEIIKVNPAGTKILGYKEDEILELGWAKLVHPDDIEKTNKQVEKQLKGSSAINFINRFRCKDGTYKILEWQATPPTDNIVYAIARDITKRKKTESFFKKNAAILEMIATEEPSSSIYNAIALMYEARHPGL